MEEWSGSVGGYNVSLMNPAYRERLSRCVLHQRAEELNDLLHACKLCPHECGVDRIAGHHGVCRTTGTVLISSVSSHFGEEPPLVGSRGSGTIFFTSCNLKCMFCQNYAISQLQRGTPVSIPDLAQLMVELQHQGCHNINLVTPTHVTPHIVSALCRALDHGLSIPLVYNCGGYESTRTLRLLEGVVDIYMPDIKYADNAIATTYSGAPGYWEIVRSAVSEMHRQVGNLAMDTTGIALRGMLIRHLVLPNELAGSRRILEFIARQISCDSYVNIMDQYRPEFRAHTMAVLNRSVRETEFHDVVAFARTLGLHRGLPEEGETGGGADALPAHAGDRQ